jgi:hypothetical protein
MTGGCVRIGVVDAYDVYGDGRSGAGNSPISVCVTIRWHPSHQRIKKFSWQCHTCGAGVHQAVPIAAIIGKYAHTADAEFEH